MSEVLNSDTDRWLAAEFALGVLTGERRQLAQDKFESVPAFRHAVEDWQEQFSPMLDDIALERPSPQVWQNIKARLYDQEPHPIPLQRPSQRWLPMALAASVALVVGLIPYWVTKNASEDVASHSAQLDELLGAEQVELAARETELNNTRAVLKDQQQTIAGLEASVENYRNRLSKLQAEREGREQQLAKAQQVIEQQRQNQQAAVREMSDLKQELTTSRSDYEQSLVKLQQLQSELEKQQNIYASTIRLATKLESSLSQRESVIRMLSSPGLEFSYLAPTSDKVLAGGHMLWNERSGTWLFYTFNLPELKTGQTYQMWFITENAGPFSAGIFQPDRQGRGVLISRSPPTSAGAISAAAVSLEPAGGVTKPTGPIYVQGLL